MTSPLGRIVEIAEEGHYLSKDRGFLVVSAAGAELGRIPLDDIAAVIATAPGTGVSTTLLAELVARGASFVLCGRNYAPAALLWPLVGHHAQQRRIESQIEASRPLSKRLWALIVAAKIRRQGSTLAEIAAPAGAFERLARAVRSGDPDNLEAQAARRYWPLMFGEEFRRDPDDEGINALLNYGYAVLRAATARAIASTGLHPGIGIFHRHPHNPMPLADDLMEPFRPIVDLRVRTLVRNGIETVTTGAKRDLAAILMEEETTAAGKSPVGTCLHRLAQSLAESYLAGEPSLDLPLLRFSAAQEGGDRPDDAPEE